jgi:hypothetical protein
MVTNTGGWSMEESAIVGIAGTRGVLMLQRLTAGSPAREILWSIAELGID